MTNRRGRGLSADEKLIKPKYRAGVAPTEPKRPDRGRIPSSSVPNIFRGLRIPRPSLHGLFVRVGHAPSMRITDAYHWGKN